MIESTRCPKKTLLSEVISFSLRSVFLGHPVVSVGLPSSLEVTVGGCYVNPNHKSNQKSPFSFPSMINPTLISLSILKLTTNHVTKLLIQVSTIDRLEFWLFRGSSLTLKTRYPTYPMQASSTTQDPSLSPQVLPAHVPQVQQEAETCHPPEATKVSTALEVRMNSVMILRRNLMLWETTTIR